MAPCQHSWNTRQNQQTAKKRPTKVLITSCSSCSSCCTPHPRTPHPAPASHLHGPKSTAACRTSNPPSPPWSAVAASRTRSARPPRAPRGFTRVRHASRRGVGGGRSWSHGDVTGCLAVFFEGAGVFSGVGKGRREKGEGMGVIALTKDQGCLVVATMLYAHPLCCGFADLMEPDLWPA